MPGGKRSTAAASSVGTAPTSGPAADLAGALHEVSNALTVILGWIEKARADGGASTALDVAAGRARQARNIVRRAIGARVPADPPREVSVIVDDAVLGLEPEARRAGVNLTSRVDGNASQVVVGDGSAIVQILTNLLMNGIAVSPPGASVRVDARSDDDWIVFGVADDGPGVPPERRATLLEAGVSTRDGGAGIGLRHAAALATESGGTLSLVETARGARFELRWPSQLSDADPASVRRMAPFSVLLGVRILVVEDDGAVIDLLDTALSGRGATIVTVRHKRELDGALASGPFDAALFDISPIQDDIVGVLMAVRGTSPDARLIVMSGSAIGLPTLPRSCDAAWVRKPFEIDEIVRALGGG